MIRQREDCPAVDTHTPSPAGYIAWHEWAEQMGKTHKQVRCPVCNFLSIWVKKSTGDCSCGDAPWRSHFVGVAGRVVPNKTRSSIDRNNK